MNPLTESLMPLTRALDLRSYRQQVLASNIANADTPQYKARDFDFRSALAGAMNGQAAAGALPMAATAAGHIANPGSGFAPQLAYRRETQSAVDGNTVDMDVERSEMADNAMQYEMLTQFISDRFRGMRSALSGTQG